MYKPSAVSSSTPTQVPVANSVDPKNCTNPDLGAEVEERTWTGAPTWIQDGVTESEGSRLRSARLPNEHTDTESSSEEKMKI